MNNLVTQIFYCEILELYKDILEVNMNNNNYDTAEQFLDKISIITIHLIIKFQLSFL